MNKTIIISSILLLTACNEIPYSTITNNPVPIEDKSAPSPTTPPITPPIVDLGTGGLKVVIHESNNFSNTDLERLEQARVILENVLNTEEFKQKVLHFTYLGEETFVQNNGYSNLEVYNLIMAGAEQYPKQTPVNHLMDLYTELYYGSSGVIGYTNPSVPTIYMNNYYFSDYTPGEIAGNLIHEWLHKLGFDHDYNSTARRPYTVPYAIGYIIDDLTSKL
jgi:hypothetical protein